MRPASPVNTIGLIARGLVLTEALGDRQQERAEQQVALHRELLQRDHERPVREVLELEVGVEVPVVVVPAAGFGVGVDAGAVTSIPAITDASTSARLGCGNDRIERRVDLDGPSAVRHLVGRAPGAGGGPAAPGRAGSWPPRSRRRSGPRSRGTCPARTPRPSARRPSARRSVRARTRRGPSSFTWHRKSMNWCGAPMSSWRFFMIVGTLPSREVERPLGADRVHRARAHPLHDRDVLHRLAGPTFVHQRHPDPVLQMTVQQPLTTEHRERPAGEPRTGRSRDRTRRSSRPSPRP